MPLLLLQLQPHHHHLPLLLLFLHHHLLLLLLHHLSHTHRQHGLEQGADGVAILGAGDVDDGAPGRQIYCVGRAVCYCHAARRDAWQRPPLYASVAVPAILLSTATLPAEDG
jgi:hypothetical protein